VCVLFYPWPDSLGKTGPGHGVGMLKRGVATMCSLALGMCSSQPVARQSGKNRTRSWCWYAKKGCSDNVLTGFMCVLFSNRGQTVWENQDQVMMLVCQKKGVAIIYSLALGCVLLNPWPDSLGKTGPGHGVGILKWCVVTICSLALGVCSFQPVARQTGKNRTRSWCW
jgi:hypothetical protein